MKLLTKLSVLCLALVFFSGKCSEEKEDIFSKKMIEFDRAFVPVLYHVYQGDMPSAKSAIFYLDFKWQQFNQRYNNANPDSPTWSDNFCLMDQWLGDAYKAINQEHQMIASIQLGNVRHQMMDMRRELQMDYFLDYIWNFEETLDLTTEIATDPKLELYDYCEFEAMVFQLNTRWKLLQNAHFDNALYEMDYATEKVFVRRTKMLGEALGEFNLAVEAAEGEQLDVTSKNLVRTYLDLLYVFGNFQESKSNYVLK